MIYEFCASTLGRIMLKRSGEYVQWLSAGQQIEIHRLIKLKKISRPPKTGTDGA